MDDLALLRAYAERQAEDAFSTLVGRYVALVYSAALRQTGAPALAEEVTQVVFIILARKAAAIRPGTILAGWLLRTTRYTAAKARARERRRHELEREAMDQLYSSESESTWRHIVPLLDEALVKLRERDRNAIALRFFEQKSFKEIGLALGVSDNTARVRVMRAVERLRVWLARRGVVVPAAALTSAITASAVQAAPPDLAASVAGVAVAKGAGVTSSTALLVNLTLKYLAWAKLKTAAMLALPLFILAGGTTYIAPLVWQRYAAPNLLRNGGFERALDQWGWHVDRNSGAQARLTREPEGKRNVARISVTTPGYYDCVELSQEPLPLQAGHKYTVSFRARSTVPQPLRVKIIKNREPWTFYGFRAITEITPQWQTFHLTSHAIVTATDAKLMFQCGGLAGDILIDEVKFQDRGGSFKPAPAQLSQ